MDPDFILNRIRSQNQSQSKHTPDKHSEGLNIQNIRERFLNALKEVARLEKVLEDKNTQLAVSAKEKDRLIHALGKAFEDEKRLHDRLADFEVLRNMEIVEIRQEIEKVMNEKNHILKDNDDLLEDLFKKDQTIDELRYAIERKDRQLQDVQTDLYTAIEAMREIESRYKDMEARYKIVEKEKNTLKEKLDAAVGPERQEDKEEIEEYKRLLDISTSEKEVLERQLSGLRAQRAIDISEYQSLVDEVNNLRLKLTDANRELSLPEEENAAGEILKEVEERYNDLEAKYKLIEEERDGLKEKLSRMDNEILLSNSLLSEKEKDSLNTERLSFEKTLESKDKEIDDINHVISELKEQRDRDISEHQLTIERLTGEKDDLGMKLVEIGKELISLEEKNAATLGVVESGYNALKENYKAIENERDALKEKLNVMVRELAQKADVESDLKSTIEKKTSENITLKNDIEVLNKEIRENQAKTKEYLEVILSEMRAKKEAEISDKESSPDRKLIFMEDERSRDADIKYPKKMTYVRPPKSRWLKRAAVVIIILIILGIAGIFFVDRLNVYNIGVISPPKAPSPPVQEKLWLEGSRQINIKDLIITVTFLTPELMENLGISSKISQEGMLKNYYYSFEIKSEKGCIPEDFINSLTNNVAFIDGSNTLIKSKREFAVEKTIVYGADSCDGETGIIFSKCVIFTEKIFNPQGIAVEGITKDSPVVIR